MLNLLAEDDKIRLVINARDLTIPENDIAILSRLKHIADFEYIAAKCIFMSYERQAYDDLQCNSPIENFIDLDYMSEIPQLVSLGITISPDATYYLNRIPFYANVSKDVIDLFVKSGGDITCASKELQMQYAQL